MDAKTLAEAKADLEKLMDEAVESHEPVIIVREGKPAVALIALSDLPGEHEAAYLLSNPVNRAQLEQSRRDIESGRVVEKTIDELEALVEGTKASAAE